MTHTTYGARTRVAAGLASLIVAGAALAGCSSQGGGSSVELSDADLDAALEEGGEITYWGWNSSAEDQVAAFEDAYPNVTVKYTNTGGGGSHNLKLQNAVTAGSGGPDVSQLEYHILPQFILGESLLDLSAAGFDELAGDYTDSTWGYVSQYDGVWGLPQDAGPMALFYNADVYEEHGLTVPTTWDEFAEQAAALRAADPDAAIAGDFGEPSFTTSMIRQAGGKPFSVEGTEVTIDLQDEGTTRWTEVWNPLIEDDLLDTTTATWSDEWFTALGDGSIASVISGAWMAGVLESSVPDGAGSWRVAPMPTYDGDDATSEMGGSSHVVMKDSDNPALVAAFVRWLSNDPESVDIFMSSGGFPSTVANLESEEFLNAESEYFGGQAINEVFLASSEAVPTDWQFLPWQSYASSIFSDTVGVSYVQRSDLDAGLVAWQDANVKYGNEQGYTVNGG
ncbi:extracellular solute-binding protein [Microbacterium marinilacus]|uniref:Sugar ABC transporter substrate-binding protein n=1 Tax=Microbacterium marinilacus TaxID=415209 RepID=A0ABP7BPM8_9MICO|nr:extracellular solute-binding protein [Microbacterium marinilacus]MBY0690395.1 extracellular solute-binding protein [Microbacterium marinilacus]